MPKISVVIITFNEQKNIERCLKSVIKVADEIVVVDSFSTDRTKEICLNYNVVFIEHKFEGHIEQKNWAVSQAKNPHILSLDADECLSEELTGSILTAKENWKCEGYKMNRLTNYCGKWIKHCGWYPDAKLRLWDSRNGSWGGINPHDEYKMKEGSAIGFLDGDILHYSYYSIEEHIKQSDYFSTIAAKAYFTKGKKATVFHLIFSPLIKFIQSYFLKLGFLDGKYGFAICKISSLEKYHKYLKLRALYRS